MFKLFQTKQVGGILLLAGTAVGGGLLALPLATAKAGFFNAGLLLIACWAMMMASALVTLEISLWLPPGANIISMTEKLLHPVFTYPVWVSYLLLFYSILAAYIAGATDLLSHLVQTYFNTQWLSPVIALVFTLTLGSVVYQGIHWIDYLNRRLMLIKILSYTALVALLLPHARPSYWIEGRFSALFHGFSVIITAFSYTNIIPSLRQYFQEDLKGLKNAILIGGSLPLLCYLLWNMSVMGVLPLWGKQGLVALNESNALASALIALLNQTLHSSTFSVLSHSFSYVCILTTFLSCSLGLSDFLADGFGVSKKTSVREDAMIYSATFLPPLIVALFFPAIFVKALHYAGIFCLILFVLTPALIMWRGRYVLGYESPYRFWGEKPSLIALINFAVWGIGYSLYRLMH